MAEECRRVLDHAAYYMDAYPIPALGISHWRDDPIVAWFDEFCQEQFESGASCRAPVLLCFRPNDTDFFLQIIEALSEIGTKREFVLKQALLIYEDQISKREQFVTVHDIVRESNGSQPPQLGPEQLLTKAFLKHLCRGLERKAKPVILPENVLACIQNASKSRSASPQVDSLLHEPLAIPFAQPLEFVT